MVQKITDLSPSKMLKVCVEGTENIRLADTIFNVPDEIDILLGAEVFLWVIEAGTNISTRPAIDFSKGYVFGYVASGSVSTKGDTSVHCGTIRENDFDKTMGNFWDIENIEGELTKNREAEVCEEHFARTHTRDQESRYVVSIPLKEEPTCLGPSKKIAIKRLNSLWKRLVKEPEYLSLCKYFLREYEELDDMRRVMEEKEPDVVL